MQFKPYQASPLKETLQAYDAMDEDTLTVQKTAVLDPIYYYHPDHLGTSTALTDVTGEPYQFFLNLPFGETMAEQLGSHYYNSPYKFNGKELDEETGLYYYGARYYDPKVSNWLSVDPLAEKFPAFSPYVFSANNPIYYVDPDGKEPTPAEAARMAAHVYGDKKNGILTGGWQVSTRDFGIKLQNESGLKSLVYERVVDGKVSEYTYATAGTEANWSDVAADLKQPLG